MICDEKHGTLFMLTKAGYLYLFEIQSGKCLFAKRISQATMFASVTTASPSLWTRVAYEGER